MLSHSAPYMVRAQDGAVLPTESLRTEGTREGRGRTEWCWGHLCLGLLRGRVCLVWH